MAASFGWGTLAASSLVIGALVALRFRIGLRAIGLIMGFHLEPARIDLLDLWPAQRRLGEVASPVDVGRDRADLRTRLARRLRPVPRLPAGHRRLRSRLRGGCDPHHAANTMMPEAYEHGGKWVGVVPTLGFAVAFAIHTLD
jgi:hypothetical protein